MLLQQQPLPPTTPTNSSESVQATIHHCLANYAYQDAIFLAERLFSLPTGDDPSESSTRLHLLATTYYRANDKLQCLELLRNHHKSVASLNYKCRFLLATVAWELDKPTLSESTLLIPNSPKNHGNQSPLDLIEKNYFETAPFALSLYGKICTATERLGVAKEAFSRGLRLNPFLFSAFEGVVKLGHGGGKENEVGGGVGVVERVFQTSHLSDSSLSQNCLGATPLAEEMISKPPPLENNKTGILMNRNNTRNNIVARCHRNLFTSTPNSFFGHTTPTPPQQPHPLPPTLSTPPTPHPHPPTPPTPSLISPIITMETSAEPKPKKPCLRTVSSPQQPWSQSSVANQQVRRSSRLFGGGGGGGVVQGGEGSNKQQSLKENTKESQQPNPQPTMATRKQEKFRKKVAMEMDRGMMDSLLATIRDLALATYYLIKYDCKKAIETIATLKPSQAGTPFAIALLAKAQFEMGEYEAAVSTFTLLRHTHPFHASLSYLSSSLWHLSLETQLSTLSQEFLSEPSNKSSPTTWITLGNTFSLQKEHETAIKFFKRAIQIDHGNYYAHVLLGHEYVATDELDKALRCFRGASRLDASRFNCWYGIGMIYFKQERFEEAGFYYERAVRGNGGNVVLLCHLGVVQSALNHPEKALATFSTALKLSPTDPLCKFHRASVLFASGRLDEALVELEELKRIVPKESLVHFLIAKIHSKQGSTHKALLHFSWATDLDPKGANNHIKESIEPVLNNSEEEIPVEENL